MTHDSPFLRHALFGLLVAAVGCDDSNDADNDTESGTSGASDATTTATATNATSPTNSGGDTTAPTSSTPTSTSASTTGVDPSGETDPTEDTDPSETTDATDGETDGESESESESESGGAACSEDLDCEDQMILDLGLISGSTNAGVVQNGTDGDDWLSQVDATAGGVQNAATTPWLYLRFTSDGLETVELDDLQALESDAWDIAAKRFGVRINSGTSGPSCVRAGVFDGTYAELDASGSTTPNAESFYDDSCTLQDDGSGIGAPNYALTPWWFYPGCVGTTYAPFVIELDDGARVKFMVESYYSEGQAECNENGAMGSGSANFVWRWAYLE